MKSIARRIAAEINAAEQQVAAAVTLLDEGATVPFIARYRKEVTGGLDDTQLRLLDERLRYLRELEERRETILQSVAEQGKLSAELEHVLRNAETKTRLEDLYLPYRPKRRTRAQIAREAGLEPLAQALLDDPSVSPEERAVAFVDADRGVADGKTALDGARQILMERFAEEADLVGDLRDYVWRKGILRATVAEGKESEGAKFRDYFDYTEPLRRIPSHRALALFRGRNEGILNVELLVDPDAEGVPPCQQRIARHFAIADRGRPADPWLLETVHWAWKAKISLHLETELMARLRGEAEAEAIRVFSHNLHDLLLAAPAGHRAIMGLDPGLRTGVKVAVVDATGRVVETATIYPHVPRRAWDESIAALAALAGRHAVDLVSIGNGTAARETDRLVLELMRRHPELGLQRLVVSEAGASVYSASELAAKEFPGLDVSLRGAVSIARRLQDPLAELVKIDPKAIGVGQYQHDVNQVRLARALDAQVEDCVNAVGVDLNTASAPLLERVSGLSKTHAENIVATRDTEGAFRCREALLKVPRIGPKTFEQAAGFLRITGGENPLDASAVHPEAYPVVERIIERTGRTIREIIGDAAFLRTLDPADLVDARFGLPTVADIIAELEKPGRDPRPEFRAAAFKEGVEELSDLEAGMVLEGCVTNVTNFGAFVDIGVHQDGLVHISAMADHYVKDPREVVKAGDVVRVKVMAVDAERRRIALTMRLADDPGGDGNPSASGERGSRRPASDRRRGPRSGSSPPPASGPLAEALQKALTSKKKR
jgi:uncharacterized protein